MNLITSLRQQIISREVLWSNTALLVYLALAKLVVHLLTANNYGYFIDEFYWLAMGQHLDFGYVDVPPLVAYLGAIWRFLFGASMFAIRILPALAGAVMVFFAGLLARELGGGRFAQWFTALMVLSAPFWLMVNSWFAYDPFDQLCTVILLYLIVRLIKQETPTTRTCARQWLGIGIMAGLGIMTKLTMIFTVGALVLALLISPKWKRFLTRWPWLATGIGILLCTPYLVWQWVHGWPLITYWRGYAVNPIRPHVEPLQFLWQLLIFLNPILLPVLLLGLFYLLFHREGKKYRPLGLSFLVLLVFFGLMKLQPRMLVSACFPLLAAGAIWLERLIGALRWKGFPWKGFLWLKRVYLSVILIGGLLLAPAFLPILPIDVLEKYMAATKFLWGIPQYRSIQLPRAFQFRFGWPEMVKKVAEVYHGLPEAERNKCAIWVRGYALAGAIDLLGKEYGLPYAISNHYSYHFWGPDPNRTGVDPEVLIMVNVTPPPGLFDRPGAVAALVGTSPYALSELRYITIYIYQNPNVPLKEIWPKLADFR